MSDWSQPLANPSPGVIHSGGFNSLIYDQPAMGNTTIISNATWPAANRALYIPFIVFDIVTVFQMAFIVAVQSGNCDVGLYTEQGVRLISAGSTGVGAAGIQTVDITDTTLSPGVYYMAMNVDNTTASFETTNPSALIMQMAGMQQQAVGAVALPDPATFANPASAYLPSLSLALKSTI